MALALAGVAVSAYLTAGHFTSATVLACSDKGLVNCSKVTTSSYSRFAGMPVAVLGVAFFVAMLGLQLRAAWRSQHALVRGGRIALAGIGVVLVLWLIYAELFRLDAICLYCTVVHVLTVALFLQTGLATAATTGSDALVEWDLDDDPRAVSGSAP